MGVATFAVVVLPALTVSFIETAGRAWLTLASVLLAIALSVAAAAAGSAIWTRRRGSRDIVFADLMVWGWLRRLRAERRLADAEALLASARLPEGRELAADARCKVLQQLAAMLEAKDADTLGHSRRVTRHAERIAREMGLPREEVARIRIAASLHDIGKLRTPRRILSKPDGLSGDELAIIKRHPVDGAVLVAQLGDPAIAAMVRHHHERIDGSGYPEGLESDDIPLGARIISVADTFDAITSARAYHDARKHRSALDVLAAEAGRGLDPVAVSAFLSYYSGREGVAWSAFGVTAPTRFAGWVGGVLTGAGGWSASLSQSLAAIVAAALAGAGLVGDAARAAAASDRASAVARPASAVARPASQPAGEARGSLGQLELGTGKTATGRSPAPVSDSPPRRQLRLPGGTLQVGSGTLPVVPSAQLPGVEAPDGEAPGVEVQGVEVPGVEVPGVETPDVEVLGVEVPGVEVPGIETPDIEVPTVQLPEADLSGLELGD